MIQVATATFNNTQDFVDVTWPAMTGAFGIAPGVTPTDGSGGIVTWFTNRTSTGARVNVSDQFTGTVELIIYDK